MISFSGRFFSAGWLEPKYISELLPHIAQRMHHLSIVRSINIKINDHEQGRQFMEK